MNRPDYSSQNHTYYWECLKTQFLLNWNMAFCPMHPLSAKGKRRKVAMEKRIKELSDRLYNLRYH